MEEQESSDRITNIPDDILRRILSFLEFRDVFRASFLSKRWKNLWKSMPELVIRESDFIPNSNSRPGCSSSTFEIIPFLNRVLSEHDHDCNIKYLYLEMYYADYMKAGMGSWIQLLAKLKVEHLDLDLSAPVHYDLPAVFYCWPTFKKLRLRCVSLNVPAYVSFASLKSLHLCCVVLVDDLVLTKIINGAPLLSCLKLDSCEYLGDVHIVDSRGTLKKLEIICSEFKERKYMLEVGFEINAPNLIRFKYLGPVPERGFEVPELVFLQYADLHFEKLVEYSPEDESEYSDIALDLLEAVRHAKSLTICPWTVQLMCEQELFNLAPISFGCSHLTVYTPINNGTDVIGVFHLLRGCKELKHLSLIIQNESAYMDYAHGYVDMEELNYKDKVFPILLEHLESVDFTDYYGVCRKYWGFRFDEFALVRLLLETAEKLHTIRIWLKESNHSEGDVKQLWHSLNYLSALLGRDTTIKIVSERVSSKG